jgi:hypothetical protein
VAKNQKPAPAEKAPVAVKQTMAKPISSYSDPAQLRTLMENAKRMGREDIWRQAFDQFCSLEGADKEDPLERAFYRTLGAYEQLLTQKNRRATRASRTRLKLKSKGVVACLEDWAKSKEAPESFDLLVAHGMIEMTGEQLVLTYPDRFSPEAIAGATARLATKAAPAG